MKTNSQRKTVIMSEVMPPERSNFAGNIHGGYIMLLLDRVAYACAGRYAKKDVVTLSMDQMLFKKPIYVGELVTFYASVNYVGNTSMEVGVKVVAEEIKSGIERHTNTCYITMVAVDEHGKPTPVEKLELKNKLEERRFMEAEQRRKLGREFQEKHTEIRGSGFVA